MLAAMRAAIAIIKGGGAAIDAVVAAVCVLEDHPLFNAGYGSLLNSIGEIEMDASVMSAEPIQIDVPHRHAKGGAHRGGDEYAVSAGAVGAVTGIKNPIVAARAVMDHTSHIMMAGAGAEAFARSAGVAMCRPSKMISPRARSRFRLAGKIHAPKKGLHGTVGAVALDAVGTMAAATSTGGVPGKLFGRVGDSAIIGAGTFAHANGAASATGQGEAIIASALCRETVMALGGGAPERVARRAIIELIDSAGTEAGIIIVDPRGRTCAVHNAESMQCATWSARDGRIDHRWVPAIAANAG